MFRHSHRVRYHETDAQGFLFNSRYLEIADVAMTEFFRDLGWTYSKLNEDGVDPSVVNVQIRFSSPARFDDEITFEVTCPRVGRSSFELRHRVVRGEEGIATIAVTYVNVDAMEAASRLLPDVVATALRGSA